MCIFLLILYLFFLKPLVFLDKSVFAVTFLPPEVIGALCARTSRAKDDLRQILLNESFNFFLPEIVLSEVNKYLSYIVNKSKLSEEEIKELLDSIHENLILVPIDEYERLMREARFTSIEVVEKVITPYRSVVSVNIAAFKPSE